MQMLHDLTNDDGYMLHSNGQQTENEVDTEKGCQNPALQQKTTVDAVRVRRYRNSTAGMAPNIDEPDSVCQAGWVSMSPAVEQAKFDRCWSNGKSTRVEIRRKK